jgi:hypothetical protein
MKAIQRALRGLGVEVHRHPSDRHIQVDYPVSTAPRYGYGRPPHKKIAEMLAARRGAFEDLLDGIASRRDLHVGIGRTKQTDDPLEPFWDNGWLPPLDAAVLMYLLAEHRPRRYVEIGSGNSTAFARHAIISSKLDTQITSVDPHPRRGIDEACNSVIRARLEEADPAIFNELAIGDILFFDGSHRAFMDSDVTVFFLETLPSLPPGVLVQIHDIYWPDDYPPQWGARYYSEQYLLGVYLLNARPEIVMANAYVSREMDARRINPELPDVWGGSFWFRT